MRKFDLYLLRDITVACLFITVTLAAVVFLTQSLRFLELVINSGASSGAFWILTLLALPRFFEIILPLAAMGSIIFVFHRMTIDSELVVIRASGFSPLSIARAPLILGVGLSVFLWIMTLWLAPVSLNNMQKMQEVIKAQFSSYFFQEGVFNSFGNGLTFYIRERAGDGILNGLLIHDNRDKAQQPSTVMAKRGVIASTEDGYEIIVYDGARQVYDADRKTLQTLNFERYTLDIPNSGPVRQRWREPDERTIFELLHPDPSIKRDRESLRDFSVEIHKRLTSPLLALSFSLIAACALLLGPVNRRGHGGRIALAILACIIIQGVYISAFNMARQHDAGFVLMYTVILLPLIACGLLVSGSGEKIRRALLYRPEGKKT